MIPYKVNVSAINQFSRCRFRWWAQYIENWVPIQEAQPLAFGRLLHEVFEASHQADISMKGAIELCFQLWQKKAETTTDSFERTMRFDALQQLDELSEALCLWVDKYPITTTLAVEEPFEIEHPDDPSIHIIGRPDREVVMNNKIWHIQNRGLAPGINFGTYIELQKRSYHEHVYAEALNRKYINPNEKFGLKYGGTLFNLVRKLKYRTKVTKKNPEGEIKDLSEMFFQHPMTIDLTSPLHKHIMACVLGYAREMRDAEVAYRDEGIIPLPNESVNGGAYGNSPDPYFKVLIGEYELGDSRYFKKRDDPYTGVHV